MNCDEIFEDIDRRFNESTSVEQTAGILAVVLTIYRTPLAQYAKDHGFDALLDELRLSRKFEPVIRKLLGLHIH